MEEREVIMKTYRIDILREAMFTLIDTEKYQRFTMYAKGHRPFKVKAKIDFLFADTDGLNMQFRSVYVNKKKFYKICVPVRDIRWITIPFKQELFEVECSRLFTEKQLQLGA